MDIFGDDTPALPGNAAAANYDGETPVIHLQQPTVANGQGQTRTGTHDPEATPCFEAATPVVTSQHQQQEALVASDDELTNEPDEDDLFGSPTGTPIPPQAVVSNAAGSIPSSPAHSITASPPRGKHEDIDDGGDFDEKDLFGDDEDEEMDERALFGSGDEADEIDEKELFGDDGSATAISHQRTQEERTTEKSERSEHATSEGEPSEMDERDIFGDLSDEEESKTSQADILKRPMAGSDREFVSLRLPNILSIEKTSFSRDTVTQQAVNGYIETKNTKDMNVVKLLNPENCIRWRFKKGSDGQILTDNDGRPQYESNTRIIEWEDGSKTMHIGSESMPLSAIYDHVVLFEENSADIHVCHGNIETRLIATPKSLGSRTHNLLRNAQYKKVTPAYRTLLVSTQEMADSKEMQELEMEQRKRQAAKQKRAAEPADASITAAFLEDVPGVDSPSMLELKAQFKKRRVE